MESFSRETAIRRDAEGRWFDGEDRIDKPKIAAAFDRWIDVAEDGRLCLKNSSGWAYVEVEGAPVFVEHARVEGEGLELSLSDGRVERAVLESLRVDGEGQLYATVREGRLDACFLLHALADLMDALEEDGEGFVLTIAGRTHRLPRVDRPVRGRPGRPAAPPIAP